MQTVWLHIHLGKRFEYTSENTHWRNVKQMQSMWVCILSGRPFEEALENTQWNKAEQVQPVWLCIFLGEQLDSPFKNTQWRKAKKNTERKVRNSEENYNLNCANSLWLTCFFSFFCVCLETGTKWKSEIKNHTDVLHLLYSGRGLSWANWNCTPISGLDNIYIVTSCNPGIYIALLHSVHYCSTAAPLQYSTVQCALLQYYYCTTTHCALLQ